MLHFLAFLIIAVSVFEKKDWLNYFKISLAVGFVVIFYALLQYFDIKKFPFALAPEARPISYIGNSAFLATHMFFLIMFATVVFFNVFKLLGLETPKENSRHHTGRAFKPLNLSTYQLTNLQTYKLTNLPTYKLIFWRYFSLLIIILSALTIFITATRGAILGLGAGILFLLVYFAFKKQKLTNLNLRMSEANETYKLINFKTLKLLNIRTISIILLSLIVIFSAAFWFTKDAAVWQKIPGLDRLAQTKILDVNDPSTQFRLITWKLSWNAFKEKPLFGWGPENYIVAYEKYYDPEYATYGESWLDRAHNKIFDGLVTQGIFGLLTYLGIFIVLVYKLLSYASLKFKSSDDENLSTYQLTNLQTAAPFIMAGLIGYFVQNLFVFDQPISYSTFFAVLGFLLSLDSGKSGLAGQTLKPLNFETLKLLKYIISALILCFILVIIYSLYFYNLVPYIQARLFKASPGISKDVNVVMDYLKKSMYPYNFAQHNIRGSGVDTIYMDQFFYRTEYIGNPKFRPLGDLLIAGMDEVAGREPYDIRVLIREVEMLNGYTRVMDEKEAAPLFEKAEKLMAEAIKRAPNRQEVYYHLAFNLAGQKRYDEAIKAAKYAISLNSKVARAHFHLALVSTIAGKNKEALNALIEVDKLDPDLKTLMSGDKDATLLIYSANGRLDKVAEIITKSLNRGENRAFDRKYYEAALRYYAVKTDAQNFIKVANYLKQFNDLKDDMEVLIDLAEKGMWNIILKL